MTTPNNPTPGTTSLTKDIETPPFVTSCKFTKQAHAFAARHGLVLVDVDLLGFWNRGSALNLRRAKLLDLDINRSGTDRKLSPDNRAPDAQQPASMPFSRSRARGTGAGGAMPGRRVPGGCSMQRSPARPPWGRGQR